MSKYILNKKNALVLNGEVFVLVREKRVTKNSVCDQCHLNDICIDDGESHHLSALCIPEEGDGRWFFFNSLYLSEGDADNIIWNIKWCLQHK